MDLNPKYNLRKLLLLCSADSERDSINMPFVDGERIYVTDGRIIMRMPLAGMGRVPVGYDGFGKFPANPDCVYPDRPNAVYQPMTYLHYPCDADFPAIGTTVDYEGSEVPVRPAVVTPCKIGNAILAPRFINLLWREFRDAEIEIESPGDDVLWRYSPWNAEGVIRVLKPSAPTWVWDLVSGGYLRVYPCPNGGQFSLEAQP